MSLNPAHGEVYSDTPVSSTNKTDHHDITGILLKVALDTITLTPKIYRKKKTYHHRWQPTANHAPITLHSLPVGQLTVKSFDMSRRLSL